MGLRWHRALPVLALMPSLIMAACPFSAMRQQLGGAAEGAAPGAPFETIAGASRHLLAKPPGQAFDLKAVEALDVAAVKADLTKLMTDSKAFWPADFGHYGGLFIRLAWHCNGSYRRWDGRGGCNGARIRFTPELAWADNTNLDKARKLLEPIKAKYGAGLSWGDLIVLAGDTAIESMGGPKIPFCLGRIDDSDGTASLELGPTPEQRAVAPCKAGDGNCENPLGQTTMGLIYVNPEGVLGIPEPSKSVAHIRRTFGEMGMNDTETVALIGGGHAFGKTHGACLTGAGLGPDKDPKNPWPGTCGNSTPKGRGKNAFTSGFEGAWTTSPTEWSNEYFNNLLDYGWEKHKGPGGHWQWRPKAKGGAAAPDIMMLTTDIALTKDPSYLADVKRFAADFKALTEEFGAAWYKLMARDMGPRTRCVGDLAGPARPFQMPLPAPPSELPNFSEVKGDVSKIVASDPALYSALAFQCASTYRATDYAGGCNGARIRFPPMSAWPVNKGLDAALEALKPVKAKHPNLSWADLIVLAGTAAQEAAGAPAVGLPFCGGRTDAADGAGTEHLAPRNYSSPEIAVKDNIKVSGLSPAEAVALAGRLRSPARQRALGYSGSWSGPKASPSGAKLSNEFYKVLLNSDWEKAKSKSGKDEFVAKGKPGVFATPEDLVIKTDPELSAIAKGYAADNAKFLKAFSAAWTKLVNADRFKGPAGSVC